MEILKNALKSIHFCKSYYRLHKKLLVGNRERTCLLTFIKNGPRFESGSVNPRLGVKIESQ